MSRPLGLKRYTCEDCMQDTWSKQPLLDVCCAHCHGHNMYTVVKKLAGPGHKTVYATDQMVLDHEQRIKALEDRSGL